jgi:hypothetical protein
VSEQFPELDVPTPEELRDADLPDHPRILASDERFEELKRQIEEDPKVREWYQALRADADEYLESQLPAHVVDDGLRLLSMSRRTLEHVRTLALVYRIDGEAKYARRAWKELKIAADFPDWNPKHFLDVGEMTHAFAIGYDWLYDYWTPRQRRVIRNAIASLGLTPAMAAYRGTAPENESWWKNSEHNWNQVTNGGVGIGAIAVMDDFPVLAANVLHGAVSRLPLAMQHYAPDGAWEEGPGYWDYATRYNVLILSALETSYETDFGLSDLPGFAETGQYAVHMTGPLGRSFNFADSGDGTVKGPELFWLADRFDAPAFAAYQKQHGDPSTMNLVWYRSKFEDLAGFEGNVARDQYFRKTEAAVFRSAWNDPEALYAGLMAGDNKANHSHLDLGTFVMDAEGVRWATELGSDDYNMEGYFSDSLRWTYYRLRAEGQNTLVLNPSEGPDQDPEAAAEISRFESSDVRVFAIADLTPAYAAHAQAVRRGLALTSGRRQVLVQDEIRADTSADVWWFMHTPAEIEITDGGGGLCWGRRERPSRRGFSPRRTGSLPCGTLSPCRARPIRPRRPTTRASESSRSTAPRLRTGALPCCSRRGGRGRSGPPCRRSGPSTSGNGALIEGAELPFTAKFPYWSNR